MIAVALFALVWIVHRAYVQSITLDEADTYKFWVAPPAPTLWEPHSNNHVLNSALMRLSVWLFGLSPLTLRVPALLGGLIFIVASFLLCQLLSDSLPLRAALFMCLVYNPFIMDYLVAARGYGLALGFLNLAIYLLARLLVTVERDVGGRPVLACASAISACTGLSVCANLSFSYAVFFLLVVTAVISAGFMWRKKHGPWELVKLGLACTMPALLVLLVLGGSAVTRFPRSQLFWGTHSLPEAYIEIRRSAFTEINPFLVNPLVATVLRAFEARAIRLLSIPCIVYFALLFFIRRRRRDQSTRWRFRFSVCLTAVLVITIGAHWLQFKLLGIPLPLERTGLWIVPLFTALLGSALSEAPSDAVERLIRGAGIASLAVAAFYFVGELRDSFFNEWRSGAEIKMAFPVVVELCRKANVREVPSSFNLTPSLNFYKTLYKPNDIDGFVNIDPMPANRPIYVLEESLYADFIRSQGLLITWHGSISDVVVAIRPNTPGLAIESGVAQSGQH